MAECSDPERYCNARELNVLVRYGDYFRPEDEDCCRGSGPPQRRRPVSGDPGLGQRDEAQFIDDEELVVGEQLLEVQQMLLVAGLDQFADQRRGSRKADTVAALTSRQAKGQREVSLPGSTVAQQQHVLLAREELASSQIEHQRFV